MRSSLLLLPCLLAAGCVVPTYQASKVVEYTLPAAGLSRIDCQSHNGDITVAGDPLATGINLRAELSVRGYSQAEADANLHLLEVVREQIDGTLRIWGKCPPGELANRSPTFRFTVKVPPAMALQLASHNGDLDATGTHGAVSLETHNGDIRAVLRTGNCRVTTHNGEIDLWLCGDGPLDGEVRSHNGDIALRIDEGLGTRVEAECYNGSVTPPAKVVEATFGKRSLKCTIGDGKGLLQVASHNGDVVLR